MLSFIIYVVKTIVFFCDIKYNKYTCFKIYIENVNVLKHYPKK